MWEGVENGYLLNYNIFRIARDWKTSLNSNLEMTDIDAFLQYPKTD